MKIRKYVKQRNVSQLPESIQDIIRKRPYEVSSFGILFLNLANSNGKHKKNSPGESRGKRLHRRRAVFFCLSPL